MKMFKKSMLINYIEMKQSFIKKTIIEKMFIKKNEKEFDIIIIIKKNRNKIIATENYKKNNNIIKAHIEAKVVKYIVINYSIR